jgi:hypothetical protein
MGEISRMRHNQLLILLVLCLAAGAFAVAASIEPGSFHTNATFSVDHEAMALSTAVATIEPRLGAAGYSWLRINFYSFPVEASDLAGILKGDASSMDKKRRSKEPNIENYNKSYAMIQLSVDQNEKVWQVDMSVPGHGCTIAPYERDVTQFLQAYRFDRENLKLKSKGSYVCDMKSLGIPNQTLGWDIDLNAQVFPKTR